MNSIFTSWSKYTAEVLAWAPEVTLPENFANEPSMHTKSQALNLLERGLRRNFSWYILLGCDDEALHIALSEGLAFKSSLAQILIIECNLEKARAFINAYSPLPRNVHIIVDTSPWALYLLCLNNLHGTKIKSDHALIHWTMPPKQRPLTLSTWRRLFLGTKVMDLPNDQADDFKLSVGAIIHPSEKHLHDFFAHVPTWVHEIVVVWDAQEVPHVAKDFSRKIKHFARPLNNDFSAQRNKMLEHCTGNWLLYLDSDERLVPDAWEQLSHMASMGDDFGGLYLPRLTFEGDDKHVRMNFGLWPDLQLRFFPLQKQVHFVGKVHEQVQGLCAKLFIAPHLALMHYSHIHKNAEELHQRLAVFNAAGSIEHKLSQAYPRLPSSFFETWLKHKACLLQLPS